MVGDSDDGYYQDRTSRESSDTVRRTISTRQAGMGYVPASFVYTLVSIYQIEHGPNSCYGSH